MFFNVNLFYVKMMMAVIVMIIVVVGQYYETYINANTVDVLSVVETTYFPDRVSHSSFLTPFATMLEQQGKKIPNFSGTACSIVELYRQMYSAVNNHYSLNSIFAFFIMSNEKFGKPRIHFHKLTESKLKDLLFRKHEKK